MGSYAGEIRLFAGTYVPPGWLLCDGSSLSADTYGWLYQSIGTTYGGVENANFNLPNLVNAVPIQNCSIYPLGAINEGASGLTASAPQLNYILATQSVDWTMPVIGEVRTFAFGVVPRGWYACNGQTLEILPNASLYSVLGTTYGGDGNTTFALPNLNGTAASGAADAQSPGNSLLGYLVMNFCIAYEGQYVGRSGNPSNSD